MSDGGVDDVTILPGHDWSKVILNTEQHYSPVYPITHDDDIVYEYEPSAAE